MARPSRETVSRAATARPAIGGGEHGRLHIDPRHLSPDHDYCWIRASVFGQEDEGNLQTAMEVDGYVPVAASEIPGASSAILPGRTAADPLIRRGGSILMKRAKEIAEERRADLQAENDALIAGVNKDLTAGMDGKNFQSMPNSGVRESVQRSRAPAPERFAE